MIRTYLGASSAAHKLFIGKYKPELDIAVFKYCVKPGTTVLDVGANIGMYAVLAGILAGEEGRVFAFEPTRKSFFYLKQNLALNAADNVHPVLAAVSDKDGAARFVEHQYSHEQNYLAPDNDDSGLTTETMRLDTYLTNQKIDEVGFAKIDVEGAELLVLQSFGDYLHRVRSLYIEFHTANYARYGFSKEDVARLLEARGFRLFVPELKNGALELAPLPDAVEMRGDCNIVALR